MAVHTAIPAPHAHGEAGGFVRLNLACATESKTLTSTDGKPGHFQAL